MLGLAVFAGCGGSSTRATPLATVPTTTGPGAGRASGTTGSTGGTGPTTTTPKAGGSAATASGLAAIRSDLAAAGSSLDASGTAIGAADVNQARTREGSAP